MAKTNSLPRITFFLLVLCSLPWGRAFFAQADAQPPAASMQLTKNPVRIWADEIAQADSIIQIAVYKFSSTAAMDALLGAKKRGVKIEMIADGNEGHGKKSLTGTLADGGVPVKYWPTDKLGELHVKLTIVDRSTVISGSFNLSGAAETENMELITIQRDFNAAHSATEIWSTLEQTLSSSGQ